MEMKPHERIFVAVDTTDIPKARALVEALKGNVGGFKIGLEMMMALLAQIGRLPLHKALGLVNDYRAMLEVIGPDMFWDGKFNDIPNTIEGASLAIAPLKPKFFNVHASAGRKGLEAAVASRGSSKALAVTVLTSLDVAACVEMFGDAPEGIVPMWARTAVEAGVDGLVCSAQDLEWLNRHELFVNVPKMTPGIRFAIGQKGDQARVMTPKEALAAGVTWMVIGRPITADPDGPVAGLEKILANMAAYKGEK